jgi:hypothetical protein
VIEGEAATACVRGRANADGSAGAGGSAEGATTATAANDPSSQPPPVAARSSATAVPTDRILARLADRLEEGIRAELYDHDSDQAAARALQVKTASPNTGASVLHVTECW